MPQAEASSRETPIPRGFNLVLTGTALLWAVASRIVAERAASGLTSRWPFYPLQPLLSAIFLLFLVVVGFALLEWIATRGGSLRSIVSLPLRPGWAREWGIGAAVGWGLALAAVLPVLLSGRLVGHLFTGLPMFGLAAVAIATLAVMSLVEELVFRGYAFRRLIEAMGPTWASLVLSFVFALMLLQGNPPERLLNGLVVGMLFGLILAMAYLRTHALWVGWGVHFAYRAVTAVVLGLPIAGRGDLATVTDSFARGPTWLTGGQFGLDGALITVPLMIAAFAAVFRLTRWYAWEYTHPEIVAAGYEVTVAPPAAHLAMEKTTGAVPPPLVQILPATPQSRSTETTDESA